MRATLALSLTLLAVLSPAQAADIVNRWTATQFDGGNIQRGDPITLFWSIVPDGQAYERSNNSDLIEYLDDGWNVPQADRTSLLNNRPWWSVMKSAYDQYNRVSGLRMHYRPEQNALGQSTGLVGDIRIGGEVIDGDPGGVLADNVFPNGGDMRIDTSRDGNGIPSGTHSAEAPLRNLISHESGHGVGLGHVEISGADAVLEGGLQSHFFGLQFDDIYGFNRNYGDPREKNGGNDALATSFDLGTFAPGMSVSLGTDAVDSTVEEFDDDWLGIDGTSDEDWFKLNFSRTAVADVSVKPIGPTYQLSGQTFDAASQSDLWFEIYDANGALIRSIDNAELGMAEAAESHVFLGGGDYFLRVLGSDDKNQFYQLDVDNVGFPELLLTVNRDTGAIHMSGIATDGVEIDGYRIQSPSGSLDPTDGSWLSFDDQGTSSWRESNPTSTSVQELLPAGAATFGDADSVYLGDFYSQMLTAPLCTPEDGDITFSYLVPGTDEWVAGAVQFVGSVFPNDLVLTVDKATGEARLTNDSQTTVQLDGYSLTSTSESLDPEGWNSFEDQSLLGWRESNPTEARLSELDPDGEMTLLPGDVLQLGQPFDVFGQQDLEFLFLLSGEGEFRVGTVVFATLQTGDFDGNGTVNGRDFLHWQRGPSVGDLSQWQSAYGVETVASAAAVPEPRGMTLWLSLVATAVASERRRPTVFRSSPTPIVGNCSPNRRVRSLWSF